jgi:hypothetical protein
VDNSRAASPVVGEEEAGNHDKALVMVQKLLKKRGLHSCCLQRISLALSAGRAAETWPDPPVSQSQARWHPPVLVVDGPQGWATTVTVGRRSGCYLVAVRGGRDSGPVALHEAEEVVALIAGPLSQASA